MCSKTILFFFHSNKLKTNQSLRIKIADALIKQFDSTKYLGITFGSNLTWKSHINELCLKHIKNSRYLVKSETFCWQPYFCHALLLSYLSFPYLWCPCLGFNLSLTSNIVIYYPEKSNHAEQYLSLNQNPVVSLCSNLSTYL